MNVCSAPDTGPLLAPQAFECFGLGTELAFSESVLDVVLLSSKKQVVRSATLPHVTLVKDSESRVDGTVVKNPREAMGVMSFLGNCIAKRTVSRVRPASRPNPARTKVGKLLRNRTVLVDFAPEFLFVSHVTITPTWIPK